MQIFLEVSVSVLVPASKIPITPWVFTISASPVKKTKLHETFQTFLITEDSYCPTVLNKINRHP